MDMDFNQLTKAHSTQGKVTIIYLVISNLQRNLYKADTL